MLLGFHERASTCVKYITHMYSRGGLGPGWMGERDTSRHSVALSDGDESSAIHTHPQYIHAPEDISWALSFASQGEAALVSIALRGRHKCHIAS